MKLIILSNPVLFKNDDSQYSFIPFPKNVKSDPSFSNFLRS